MSANLVVGSRAVTSRPAALPSSSDGHGGRGGRHRRVDPDAVVHLVFTEGREVTMGVDHPDGRSLAHLAALLLAER